MESSYSSFYSPSSLGYCINERGNLLINIVYHGNAPDRSDRKAIDYVRVGLGQTFKRIHWVEVDHYEFRNLPDPVETVLCHINYALTCIKCDGKISSYGRNLIGLAYRHIRDKAETMRPFLMGKNQQKA